MFLILLQLIQNVYLDFKEATSYYADGETTQIRSATTTILIHWGPDKLLLYVFYMLCRYIVKQLSDIIIY